jgi:DNA-binding MarR family transcriptional regulator
MHHFALLLALAEREGLPQQTISTLVGVDPRNAVPLVDDLETRGLVTREADPSDRRRYKISLTREGHRKMNTLRVAGVALEEEMLETLNEHERDQLHALLVKLFLSLEG